LLFLDLCGVSFSVFLLSLAEAVPPEPGCVVPISDNRATKIAKKAMHGHFPENYFPRLRFAVVLNRQKSVA
jgi:hypothetical protein